MRKNGFFAATLGLALGMVGIASAKPPEVTAKICAAQDREPVPLSYFSDCLRIAQDERTGQKVRGQIYVTLGWLAQWQYVMETVSGDKAVRDKAVAKIRSYFLEGMRVDPENLNAYFANNTFLSDLVSQEEGRADMEQIIKRFPKSGYALASLAEMSAYAGAMPPEPTTTTLVQGLCNKAIELEPSDYSSLLRCGKALNWVQDAQSSIAFFKAATHFYRFDRIYDIGTFQPGDAYEELAAVYKQEGNIKEAAAVLEELKALSPPGYFSSLSGVTLARNQIALKQFGKAAKTYDDALPSLAEPFHTKAKLVAALLYSREGNSSRARQLVEELKAVKEVPVVLVLQVKMRNSGFDYVEINGRLDANTLKAIDACLSTTTCFDESVSEKL